MCTFIFSYKAIVQVHENLILIPYAIIPKVISIILPLMTKMFSGIYSAWLNKARFNFWPKSPS